MPQISEKTTIPSPPEAVWPLLSDPALVAACIPGATLAPEHDGDLWKGSIRVKFGPTVAVFRGEATLTYDHAAMKCTIEGRGIDQRGASRALANGIVTASGTDTTTLTVDGDYTVTGPLEAFANAGGVHVARALLAEFSANMAKLAAERAAPVPAPAPAATTSGTDTPAASPAPAVEAPAPAPSAPRAPVAARELSAMSLLWAAFKSWLSDLFRKRTP